MNVSEKLSVSYTQHQQQAAGIQPRCAVVTLSDTRTLENDVSGQLIARLLRANGAVVERTELLRDDADPLRSLLASLLSSPAIDCIITTGGTGIAKRDQAIDVVTGAIEIQLPGFGELFRMLSYQQVGAGAMLSRAVGGVAGGKLLFALPGSPAAIDLAMTRLILPELRHLLDHVRS